MTNINTPFQTLSSEKDENTMMNAIVTGKEAYASPKLVRIGSAQDTSYSSGIGPDASVMNS